MILLDTCIMIDYFRNKENAVNFIKTIGKSNFIFSSASIIELYTGVHNKDELRVLKKEIQFFGLIEIDKEVSVVAQKLAETYALSHHIGLGDSLIAATALVYDLDLRTYNLKDFQFIPTLKVSNSLS